MCRLIVVFTLCIWTLVRLPAACAQQLVTANDPYQVWATQHWGAAVVADLTQEATVWGPNADPDHDGRTNLEEYALGTDPTQIDADPLVRDYGASTPGYLTLTYVQRANDPALVVFPQYSDDMQTWWPVPPRDAFSWQGDSTYFWNTTSGAVVNGMQTVSRVSTEPLANSTAAFARVLVLRNSTQAVGSPLDAVQFFDSVSGQGGASVDSNSVVLSGFAGSVAVSVTGGARLIVNGVDVGTSPTNVSAGSTVRIRATSPTTASSVSYNLSIGGVLTRTWNVTTQPVVAPTLVVPPGVSSAPSGYTSVSASVGDSGAASISIPITVSPGTAGMEPKLSISYSSQGGNGTLGIGFGVSGLSTISRTGAVQYLDGFKGGVSFGPNDRFTVDGQRLILYSGTWGADGSEYRTENESFSKITYHAAAAGSDYWEMQTKAGLTYDYGMSSDSRIAANRSSVPGDTAALAWALTTVTDVEGSRYRCVYAAPVGTDGGYPRITSIVYTENASQNLTAGEEVDFTYAARPDVRTSYVAGAQITMGQRLTAIDCKQGGNVARHYDFAYQQAGISGNSQLVSVTEKGEQPTAAGAAWQAFPPTTFTWYQNPAATTMSKVTDAQATAFDQMSLSKSPPSLVVEGDFRGDGHMGLVRFDDHYADTWVASGKNDGTFTFNNSTSTPAPGFTAADSIDPTTACLRTGDFNGDGKTDILYISKTGSNNWVALSKGDGSFTVLRGTQLDSLNGLTQTGDYTTQIFAMDVTGDGRTDLVLLTSTSNGRVFISNGNGSFKEVDPGAAFKALRVTDGRPTYEWNLPGDYNGDGLGDILFMYYTGACTMALSNGDGTFTVRTGAQLGGINGRSFALSYSYMVSGDFNGDGLTDVANFQDQNPNAGWIAQCKGDGSFDVIVAPPALQGLPVSSLGGSVTHVLTGDFNGDGFTDIYNASYYPYYTSSWQAFSEGNTNFSTLLNGQMGMLDNAYYDPASKNTAASFVFVGDFDGDGTDDVLDLRDRGPNVFLARSNGFSADRVVQVTNGQGGYTKFNYKPLTDPTVYTKGTTAVYPDYDVIGAMYVVSSIVTRNGGMDTDAFSGQPSGASNESTTTYTYERAWSVLDGHGYQGFAAVQSTDQDTGITSRTEYVTGDPNLSGRPAHQIQTLSNGVVVSETLNTWTSNPITLPSTLTNYFPYTTQSITKDYEINNGAGAAPIKTTTISGQAYDAFGNLTQSTTDYGGGFTETTLSHYNNDTTNWWLGRLSDTTVNETSPGPISAQRYSTFQYSPTNGQLTRETIATSQSNLQLQKDYLHDAFGNIKQSTLTDLGNPTKPRVTTTTYTPDGRFINQTTNAAGQVEGKTYDPLNGTVLSQTGPNGITTSWTYDGFGRPLSQTTVASDNKTTGPQSATWYLLCAPGNGVPPRAVHCVITQSAGAGPSTVYFDILDRPIRQDATGFDGSTVSVHTVFDAKGETIKTSIPFFSSSSAPTAPVAQYTSNTYDAIGRVIQQNVPGASTETGPRITSTVYAGLTATVTNPKKETFQSTVDLRGRTAATTSFGTDTVTNTHDPYGNLVKVDDGNGHVTTMQYDARGNKIDMTEPNSGTTLYGYDAFGEPISQTDALQRTTTLSYDGLGRMISRVEPDAPGMSNGIQAAGRQIETDWIYDTAPYGIGKLAAVSRTSDSYQENYRYDILGRLIETVTQVGAMRVAMSTSFDEYSRPDTISYPTGFAVRNSYNQYGHLAYVYNALTPSLHYWTATTVNARGQILQEQLGNSLVTRRGYDANTGLLQTIQTGSSTGTPTSIQNLAYTFDNINNLTQRQDLNRAITEGFTYDARNQLSGVTCSAADPITIACDQLGNITGRSDVGTYNYGENGAGPHAVTSIVGTNGLPSRILSYNAVGNCVQDGTTTLEYNAANQPVAIRAAGGTILFSYSASRARLKRTEYVNGAVTNRVYVGSLYERDDGPSGIVHTCFIPAGGGVVAIHTQTQAVGSSAISQTRYVHKDHLGSVQALTDENGYLVETQDYDAWGRRRTYSAVTGRFAFGATSQTDRGFTGHEMLDAVGLIHMNGRIYDPTLGRFLSVDPVVQESGNLQNLNRYCYVLNNPLSLTDPSGFFFRGLGRYLERHLNTIFEIGHAIASILPPPFNLVVNVGISETQAFTGTLLSGGSIGDALKASEIAGIKEFAFDSLTAGADFEVGEGFSTGADGSAPGFFANAQYLKPLVHGVVNGGINAAEGGGFKHGFLAAFATSAFDGAPSSVEGITGEPIAGRVTAAIIGGTASELGGGKFANGAVTGAFLYTNNDEQHPNENLGLRLFDGDKAAAALNVGDSNTLHFTFSGPDVTSSYDIVDHVVGDIEYFGIDTGMAGRYMGYIGYARDGYSLYLNPTTDNAINIMADRNIFLDEIKGMQYLESRYPSYFYDGRAWVNRQFDFINKAFPQNQ